MWLFKLKSQATILYIYELPNFSPAQKLQGIPLSAFYSEDHKSIGENYIRFCFIKKDETLDKAETIIQDLKKSLWFGLFVQE